MKSSNRKGYQDKLVQVGAEVPTPVYEHFIMLAYADDKKYKQYIRAQLINMARKAPKKQILIETIAAVLWRQWADIRYKNAGKLVWIRAGADAVHFEVFLEEKEREMIKRRIPLIHLDSIIDKLKDLYAADEAEQDYDI